jgi:hypothetical protein
MLVYATVGLYSNSITWDLQYHRRLDGHKTFLHKQCVFVFTVPMTRVCTDTVNCTAYGTSVCTEYKDWSSLKCAKHCGLCDIFMGLCHDKLGHCNDYSRDVCTEYRDWSLDNCATYCGWCDDFMSMYLSIYLSLLYLI